MVSVNCNEEHTELSNVASIVVLKSSKQVIDCFLMEATRVLAAISCVVTVLPS